MLKKIVFVLLTVFLIFLVRESFVTSQESQELNHSLEEVQTAAADKAVQKTDFYPSPPPKLPDVADNYIFNAERHLVTEEEKKKKSAEKEDEEEEQGPEIDMENLIYSGSIIIGEKPKALVSYKEKIEEKKRRPFPGRRSQKKSNSKQQFALLGVSDTLGQYKVITVQPEKIIFEKDGETVEKMLYEQDIDRLIVPSNQGSRLESRARNNRDNEQEQGKGERRTVIFSSKPGDKDSSKAKDKESRGKEKQIRIPFR